MSPSLDIQAIRKQFPGLSQDQVFMDNAGGSQILGSVVDSISSYLLHTNVQLGATYPVSVSSTSLYNAGHLAASKYMNAPNPQSIIHGPSTTQLMRNLSISLLPSLAPDSELILSKLDHEANLSSWVQLAARHNFTIKWWTPTSVPDSNPQLDLQVLKTLLSPRTKIVACTHTSNILGTITPIRAIADMVHSTVPGAYLVVDAVAYAPHRPIDVQALDVDFYAFSWYKVYGPHVSVLYAHPRIHSSLDSLAHYFKKKTNPGADSLEAKLDLAAANYESVQSIPHIVRYIDSVGWDAIISQETNLQNLLLSYLGSKPGVTIHGESLGPDPDPDSESRSSAKRVPVISFTVDGRSSRDVVETLESRDPSFGFRWGHFYSKRLVDEVLGLTEAMDGVVRVSLCHYNTEEEVRNFIKALDEVLGGE